MRKPVHFVGGGRHVRSDSSLGVVAKTSKTEGVTSAIAVLLLLLMQFRGNKKTGSVSDDIMAARTHIWFKVFFPGFIQPLVIARRIQTPVEKRPSYKNRIPFRYCQWKPVHFVLLAVDKTWEATALSLQKHPKQKGSHQQLQCCYYLMQFCGKTQQGSAVSDDIMAHTFDLFLARLFLDCIQSVCNPSGYYNILQPKWWPG